MKIILGIFFTLIGSAVLAQVGGFSAVSANQSNVTFSNNIVETRSLNIMNYDYLYNGGGVGIGDFNMDGLQDVFFSGNMVEDELYLNRGNFIFEKQKLPEHNNINGWSTGVCVFDVNGDGWDDIYVCRSGADSSILKNVLYVNQQNGLFKEDAQSYGLDIEGHHIQASPLDIDLDGDLDLYIMGHPGEFQHKVNYAEMAEKVRTGAIESDILLENVGGKYIDITRESKIVEYGYGLGLAITDINLDGYPDIIVCNDFDEPDHLFINQQNNTFKDENLSYFKHTSNYSMGNDVADFNNDGLLDYLSVDMAFDSHERSKTNMASMDLEKFNTRVQLGWGYQYMHNMLHLNTGLGTFQEIAQLSGVAKTDWSWAPLFMDIDQDGKLDLFVTNGYKRDTKNNDIKYKLDALKEKKGDVSLNEFLDLIPSVKIENYFFRNNGDLTFSDKRSSWGVNEKLNSNGAAYVDLDNDGDLDLILNNVDTLASIYENRIESKSKFLVLDFSELSQEVSLGKKITIETKQGTQIRENYFVRGYQSTVDKRQFIYCSEADDFLKITIGTTFEILNPEPNKTYVIDESMLAPLRMESSFSNSLAYFEDITAQSKLEAAYLENSFNDFEKESLLPHKISTSGPAIVVADLDKNGFEDFIVSSAVGQIPMVYLQNSTGKFKKILSRSFYNHHAAEDGDMTVFDINGDKNLDLVISSGGYEYQTGDSSYQNRLYIGNGLGMFGLVKNCMPIEGYNSGKILRDDIDKDGDQDLIIFGTVDPLNYPKAGTSKIYLNTNGFYKDATSILAPEILSVGMVNDAVLTDFDSDGDLDIVIVGEWMDITIFENSKGKYSRRASDLDIPGWWSCIEVADVDGDGDDDYLVGNAGMNNKYRPSKEKPLEVYVNDFDDNGTADIVFAYDKETGRFPVRGRECSSSQMPFIVDKFPTFLAFATSSLEDIYSKEKLDSSSYYRATEFRSGIIYNNGKEGFSFTAFSLEGQFSFINDFEFIDVNGDGLKDIVAIGNRFNSEVETTRYDAGCGIVYLQNIEGGFDYVTPLETNFFAPYNAKSLCRIKLANGKEGILVGNNNQIVQLFQLNY